MQSFYHLRSPLKGDDVPAVKKRSTTSAGFSVGSGSGSASISAPIPNSSTPTVISSSSTTTTAAAATTATTAASASAGAVMNVETVSQQNTGGDGVGGEAIIEMTAKEKGKEEDGDKEKVNYKEEDKEKEREKNVYLKTEKEMYESSANSVLQPGGKVIQVNKIEKDDDKMSETLSAKSSTTSSSSSFSTPLSTTTSTFSAALVAPQPLPLSQPLPLPLSLPLPLDGSKLQVSKPSIDAETTDETKTKKANENIKLSKINLNTIIPDKIISKNTEVASELNPLQNKKQNEENSDEKIKVEVTASLTESSSLISVTFQEESASVEERMFLEEVVKPVSLSKDSRTLIPGLKDEKNVANLINEKNVLEINTTDNKIIEKSNEITSKDSKSIGKSKIEVEQSSIDWGMMKIRGSDIYSRAQGGVEGGRYSQSVPMPPSSPKGGRSRNGPLQSDGNSLSATDGLYSKDKKRVVYGLSGTEMKTKTVAGTGDGVDRVADAGVEARVDAGAGTGAGALVEPITQPSASAPSVLTPTTSSLTSQNLPPPLPLPLPLSSSILAKKGDVPAPVQEDINNIEISDGASVSDVMVEEVVTSITSKTSVEVDDLETSSLSSTSLPSASLSNSSSSSSSSPSTSSSSSPSPSPLTASSSNEEIFNSTVSPFSNDPSLSSVSPLTTDTASIRSVRAAYVMAVPQAIEATTRGQKSVKRPITPYSFPVPGSVPGSIAVPTPAFASVPVPVTSSVVAFSRTASTDEGMEDIVAVATTLVQPTLPSSTSPLPSSSTVSLSSSDATIVEIDAVKADKMIEDNDVVEAVSTLQALEKALRDAPRNVLQSNEIQDVAVSASISGTQANPLTSSLPDPSASTSSSTSFSSSLPPSNPSLSFTSSSSSSSSSQSSSSPPSAVNPQSVAVSLGIADSARKVLYQQATEGRARTLTSTVMDIIGPSGPPVSPLSTPTQSFNPTTSKEFETTNSDSNSNIYSMNNRNKNMKNIERKKINESDGKLDGGKAFIDGYSPATVGSTARRAWQVPVSREGQSTSSLLSAASPSPRLSPTLSQLSNKRLQPRPYSSFPPYPPPSLPSPLISSQSLKVGTPISVSSSSPKPSTVMSAYPEQLQEAELVRRTYGLGLGISTDGEIIDIDVNNKDGNSFNTVLSEEEENEMKQRKKEAEAKARSEWVESVMARAKNAEIKARKQEKVSNIRSPTKSFSKEKNSPWPF